MGFPWRSVFGFGAKAAGKMACASEIARLEERLKIAERERDYWQARAETLIDAALARTGHTPVMSNTPVPTSPDGLARALFSGLSVKEIHPKEGDARS